MRGKSIAYLLAVSACAPVAGCADIRESQPPIIMIYLPLQIDETASFKTAVEISLIQKTEDAGDGYIPSPGTKELWLRQGSYKAKLTCLRTQGDRDNAKVLGRASPANNDGYFYFTMKREIDPKWKVEYSFYQLDCGIGPDGKSMFVIDPIIEITGE